MATLASLVSVTPEESMLQGDFQIVEMPGLTWRLRFDGQPATGMIDGTEAIKQTIYMALQAHRYHHAIYSWDYGTELYDLYGQPNDAHLRVQLQDAIEDAILHDDRIESVDDFTFAKGKKNAILISFTVSTTQGAVPVRMTWEDGKIVEVGE